MFGVCTFATAQADKLAADKQAKASAQTAARTNSITNAAGSSKASVVSSDAADIAAKQAAVNAAAVPSDVVSPSHAASATDESRSKLQTEAKQAAIKAKQATAAEAKKTNDN